MFRRKKIRSYVAGKVTAVVGVLYLDYLGALIGEELCTKWPGPILLNCQDPDAMKGKGQLFAPPPRIGEVEAGGIMKIDILLVSTLDFSQQVAWR